MIFLFLAADWSPLLSCLTVVPSAPKCFSTQSIFHQKNAFVLSNPFPSKPSIYFSAQKPFYSQPKNSSWWLSLFWCFISRNLVNRPRCKQKQRSGWDSPFNLLHNVFLTLSACCWARLQRERQVASPLFTPWLLTDEDVMLGTTDAGELLCCNTNWLKTTARPLENKCYS